jgi:hypothetical protein
VLRIIAAPWHIDIIIAFEHAEICDYRLEPGDIDIIIALTHAAIYDFHHLNPLYIDIIALTQQIYDYRLEPGDIDIIIAHTRRNL